MLFKQLSPNLLDGMSEAEFDLISLKGKVMADMLNGSIDWTYGCYLRDKIDEEINEPRPPSKD